MKTENAKQARRKIVYIQCEEIKKRIPRLASTVKAAEMYADRDETEKAWDVIASCMLDCNAKELVLLIEALDSTKAKLESEINRLEKQQKSKE